MSTSRELTETLRLAQRFGFFGSGPIDAAIAHSRQFVDAVGPLPDAASVLDLGSGGGLPGLVLADAFPHARVTLLDRREKRTDFLARAVARLGFDHVEVRCDDARRVVDAIHHGVQEPFDVVTARGFGPPSHTLAIASACCARDGHIVISEPPSGNRWPAELLSELGLRSVRVGAVRRFSRGSSS